MTQEEKAKRYDEALERARIWKDKSGMPKDKQGILDNIFPELAENEDERIRREITSILRNAYWTSNRDRFNELVAWLEKQGEQKPAWSEGDEVKINRIVACLENLDVADNDILLKDVDWLKSLKERYTWKPSDEQMEALESATENCAYSEYQDCLRELIFQLKKLKEK